MNPKLKEIIELLKKLAIKFNKSILSSVNNPSKKMFNYLKTGNQFLSKFFDGVFGFGCLL